MDSSGIRHRTLVRVLESALLAPLLLLAACGSGHDSVADPPISSSPSSSSPTQPAQRESPEHFIGRFVSVSNEMEMHGSTSAYLALTRDCEPCRSLAAQIKGARSDGGFYRSKGWTITAMDPAVVGRSGSVDVSVRSAPTAFKMTSRAAVQHYSGGAFTFRLAIRWTNTGWKVTGVTQVAK
jgi:hypothetical protein